MQLHGVCSFGVNYVTRITANAEYITSKMESNCEELKWTVSWQLEMHLVRKD